MSRFVLFSFMVTKDNIIRSMTMGLEDISYIPT